MALPQQVIDRLSKEPTGTPGWSFGLLLFSGGIFAISLLVYFGLTLGYEPYLGNQISALKNQIDTAAQAVSASDQARLVTFYSEISNVKTALANHVFVSHLLAWLEANTEANVSYSRFSFSSGNQVSLAGSAASEADVNQQVAIFQASPVVKSYSLSGVSFSSALNVWQFGVLLTVDPAAVLLAQTQ